MRQHAPRSNVAIALVVAIAWGGLAATASAAAHRPPPPAAPNRRASPQPDEMEGLFNVLSRDEIDELVRTALVARLRVERRQVAAEIRGGVLYSAADVRGARAILDAAPDTLADNVDRICRAFAAVDEQFALALDLHRDGNSPQAAEAVRKILDPHQITYLSAAKHLLYADALAAGGQGWEAADAYAAVWERMPDRVSLAAVAAIRAAQTWEKIDRGFYAWRMYEYALRNYGLSLGEAQLGRLTEKAEQLRRIYEDPFRTLAEMMAPIRSRLAGGDSGKLTQQNQDEVARLIEDLIRTAEENTPDDGDAPPSSESARTGADRSRPAPAPALPGKSPRAAAPSHRSDDPGAWIRLRPRRGDPALEALRKGVSERYRDAIRDYHSRMAAEADR